MLKEDGVKVEQVLKMMEKNEGKVEKDEGKIEKGRGNRMSKVMG